MSALIASTLLLTLSIAQVPAQAPAPALPQGAPAVAGEPRRAMLEQAFEIASMVPTEVHGRDRAKLQALACESLVRAGEVDRAIGLGAGIDGWRRGEVYAVAALELAKAGKAEDARLVAKRALSAAPSALDWQRQRLNVSVARVYAWLGDDGAATELEKGIGEPDMGRVAAAKAGRIGGGSIPAEYFESQMKALEDWITTKNFDLVRNSVEVALEFYGPCLADPARRARIESLVAAAIEQVPYDLRVRFHLRMADTLRARGEAGSARERVAKAEAIISAFKWLTEDLVVQRAAVAACKARLGDAEAARKDLEAAMAAFDAGRAGIVDIYRAAPLRAVAGAFAELKDEPSARAVYLRALDEGAVNPNARPRATDLVETVVAMADAGVALDPATEAKVASIQAGLVAPW